jgi:uncharacterized protein YecE (DUF72 family)
MRRCRIGTAGWSIPRKDADAFPAEGTSLERYARVFRGVEVNSSFHRSHRPSTWAKWADSVPEQFRFSVKIPKTITHQAKLVDAAPLLAPFAEEVRQLGPKLAVLLVQLPPKLAFDPALAERFFGTLRSTIQAEIACEPRNASWFEDDADAMLRELRVARVAADPALNPGAAVPGGWQELPYWRLHGSPDMYRSSYEDAAIDMYAARIQAAIDGGLEPWCVFDNTAASQATGNALSLLAKLNASFLSGGEPPDDPQRRT